MAGAPNLLFVCINLQDALLELLLVETIIFSVQKYTTPFAIAQTLRNALIEV